MNINTAFKGQSRCQGCEKPFIYGWADRDSQGNYVPGSGRRNDEEIVQDSSKIFWHEACWTNPDMEEKHAKDL